MATMTRQEWEAQRRKIKSSGDTQKLGEFNKNKPSFGSSAQVPTAAPAPENIFDPGFSNPQVGSYFESEFGLDKAGNDYAGGVLRNSPFGTGDTYSLDKFSAMRPDANNLEGERSRIEDSLYGRYTKDLDHDFAKDKEALDQDFQSRGIPIGSELYNEQMKNLKTSYDDRRNDAKGRAVEAGGSEWSRSYGIGQDSVNQRIGDYNSNWSNPLDYAGKVSSIGQGGDIALNAQNLAQQQSQFDRKLNQDKYQFGKTFGLEAQRLAMAGRSGGGGARRAATPQETFPAFNGGLPTGYAPVGSTPKKNPGQNLFNSAIQGAVGGASNAVLR